MLNGVRAACRKANGVMLKVRECDVRLDCFVTSELVGNVDVILGMDCIEQLGGVTLGSGRAVFGSEKRVHSACGVPDVCGVDKELASNGVLTVSDQDFEAVYKGEKWVVT